MLRRDPLDRPRWELDSPASFFRCGSTCALAALRRGPTCSGAIPLTTAPNDQALTANRLRDFSELGVGRYVVSEPLLRGAAPTARNRRCRCCRVAARSWLRPPTADCLGVLRRRSAAEARPVAAPGRHCLLSEIVVPQSMITGQGCR